MTRLGALRLSAALIVPAVVVGGAASSPKSETPRRAAVGSAVTAQQAAASVEVARPFTSGRYEPAPGRGDTSVEERAVSLTAPAEALALSYSYAQDTFASPLSDGEPLRPQVPLYVSIAWQSENGLPMLSRLAVRHCQQTTATSGPWTLISTPRCGLIVSFDRSRIAARSLVVTAGGDSSRPLAGLTRPALLTTVGFAVDRPGSGLAISDMPQRRYALAWTAGARSGTVTPAAPVDMPKGPMKVAVIQTGSALPAAASPAWIDVVNCELGDVIKTGSPWRVETGADCTIKVSLRYSLGALPKLTPITPAASNSCGNNLSEGYFVCTPLRPGAAILGLDGTRGTMGFVVASGVGATRQRAFLTAKHVVDHFTLGGGVVRAANRNTFPAAAIARLTDPGVVIKDPGQQPDVALVRVQGAVANLLQAQPRLGRLLTREGRVDGQRAVTLTGIGAPTPGETACMAGSTTSGSAPLVFPGGPLTNPSASAIKMVAVNCGRIVDVSADNTFAVRLGIRFGDSGGAVFDPDTGKALGIVSGVRSVCLNVGCHVQDYLLQAARVDGFLAAHPGWTLDLYDGQP